MESRHGAFYTGGNVEWHEDVLYCQTATSVHLLNAESGNVVLTIAGQDEENADTIHTFTSDGARTVTSHKSGLFKLWNSNGELEKMWKYIHRGPVARLALKGGVLASGGSDGVLRIWDLDHQACTASLKGAQGVISVVEFHPEGNLIFASGDDGKIYSWDLNDGKLEKVYDGHFSKVNGVVFHSDMKRFVSSGRDKVLILWGINQSGALRTVPVFEAVETICGLPVKFKLPDFASSSDSVYVASAGENGIVRVWDVTASKVVFTQSDPLISKAKEEGGLAVVKLLVSLKQKRIAVVSAEHNIVIHELKSFICSRQFIGFSDEILDITYFGKGDTHIAVATNSNDIKVYENSSMNCQLLKGHSDIVLALTKAGSNPNLLLSSSKDNSIRLWLNKDGIIKCVGVGQRHTGSVGAVAFNHLKATFALSASQDTCLKLWEIPNKLEETHPLTCKHTTIAHDKDINCVTVSPNDKIIATASQDKTTKLWSDSLTLLGVLRGHKRGVWCARFSPVDQVVLTSSADCTIKLWSITEMNCLKTLEGHESSVLRAEFLSNGMQILTTGSDGLLKLFSVKTSECTATFDEHQGRVWALAVKTDESGLVTGGSDSLLLKWKDVTEEKKLEKIKQDEEVALEEQKLSNYLQNNSLLDALKLALKLDRPQTVLRIIQGVIKKQDSRLVDTVAELRDDQKESLLKCATTWNTNGKNCQPAQLVLNILINEIQCGKFKPVGLGPALEGALPYTDRHLRRVTKLYQDLHFVKYTIHCMQPHVTIT